MQVVDKNLRTFFFRCPVCGSEFLNTIDLSRYVTNVETGETTPSLPTAPVCSCGALMNEAKIPRVVIPEPGGDGHTYEVMELKT